VCVRFLSENLAAMIAVTTQMNGNLADGDDALLEPKIGRISIFAVEDNGQGNGAAPDKITHILPLADDDPLAAAFCGGFVDDLVSGLIPDFTFETLHGNVTVRAPTE